MRSTKHLLAILVCLLPCLPVVSAQDTQSAQTSSDVTIIIQQDNVRFTTQKLSAEIRLQVFNQASELVFDSGAIEATEVNWPLKAAGGESLKSGLYAYTLSIKEAGVEARLRRGHFIVDRAKDRDGTDKLWVTSQNESGVGTDLTVAKDENATVAGAAISNGGSERTIGQRTETADRDATGRTVEAEARSQTKTEKSVAAAPAATVGRIAKFISATEVGDSLISESVNGVQLPNGVQLGLGAQGNQVAFGSPNGETGMSIAGTSGRADIRYDGTLKLVAGLAGVGPPPATNGIAITKEGNVGIGTVTPLAGFKLDTRGPALFNPGGNGGGFIGLHTPNGETGLTINGNGTTRADLRFDSSTLKLVASSAGIPAATSGIAITTAGNVGIGTGTPATKLHVESPGFAEIAIRSTNERAILSLNNGLNPQGYVWTLESGVGGNFPSLFGIYNRNVNKPGLTIDGNLLVSVKALQITGGADFAENFDVRTSGSNDANSSAPEIQPGMVVAIDPINPGKLELSRRAYDRRVAGIISGAGDVKPGMMMGQTGTLADGKYPVALSGRVYAWVDATRGAVRPGDLLTTSPTPGHAMKAGNSAKAQGAIIGKAMTELKSGKGLVLVLVTLQ
ncbi:MAG: hypothetical protein AAB401_20005 [Acidobacteriota bacterium]